MRFEFKDTDNGDVGSGSYSLWNVFTDNKEYTTEEAVSAVLNSANQSSVMDEYIFKPFIKRIDIELCLLYLATLYNGSPKFSGVSQSFLGAINGDDN